jgi:hypothetical protein
LGAIRSKSISFRYHLVQHLLQLISIGGCGAVVGMAGVGKSELARYLPQIKMQEIYPGRLTEPCLLIWVDPNSLTSLDEWHFIEYLIYLLRRQSEQAGIAKDMLSFIDQWHEKAVSWYDQAHILRCFQEIIDGLGQVYGLRLVFLFDQFDELLEELPSRLFINLRSMRDRSRQRLGYIIFLRKHLDILQSNAADIEPFAELFLSHTLGLKPYDLSQTETMLIDLSERQQMRWPARYTGEVFDFSGGHAGLIGAIFRTAFSKLTTGQHLDFTLENAAVRHECEKIWSGLPPDEQLLIREIAGGRLTDPWDKAEIKPVFDRAVQKGVISLETNRQPRLFARLFAQFVQQTVRLDQSDAIRLKFDEASQTCWIDGEEIILPQLPAKLLGFLYHHRGKTCRYNDILRHLYPEENHEESKDIPDYRLPAVVKSLREKIDADPQREPLIKTVRGVGLKLVVD